jgi:hypothetical protein
MFSTRIFDGFIELHPKYEASCDMCNSDIASFYDIDESQDLCSDCCNDVWYARLMLNSVDIISNKWCEN